MGKEWPVEEFNAYLEGLMKNAGITDREELSQRVGMNSAMLSRWRTGAKQPSKASLERLAEALDVKPALLWIQAGLMSPADLDMSGEADYRVLPVEVQQLIDMLADPRLAQDERDQLLAHVGLLVSGTQARLDQAGQPNRAHRVNRLA